jgi:microcystin-dependent protein
VFISVVSTSPATLLGVGSWTRIAQGRMLIGQNDGDSDFDVAEETGGAKTTTLTTSELPAHTHTITDPQHTHIQNSHNHVQDPHQHGMAEGTTDGSGTFMDRSNAAAATTAVTDLATATNQAATAVNQNASTGITGTNSAGSGAAFSRMPPYLVVYIWKRTS